MHLYAIAPDPADLPGGLGSFANYGILGVLAIILLGGIRLLFAREMARADRLEAEVNRLNTLIQEKHLPVLEAATAAIKDSTDALASQGRDYADALRASTEIIKANTDVLNRVSTELEILRRQNRGSHDLP